MDGEAERLTLSGFLWSLSSTWHLFTLMLRTENHGERWLQATPLSAPRLNEPTAKETECPPPQTNIFTRFPSFFRWKFQPNSISYLACVRNSLETKT